MEIHVLLIGDIVGKPGRTILKERLPGYIQEHGIDFVIANGENAAQGAGITENLFKEIVSAGVDCVTCGDHVWRRKEILPVFERDRRILRLIQKWLKAGVSEEGEWTETRIGTPQGAVISPLLANIYLHYVFDLWVNQWRGKWALGDMIVVRYADDAVLGFEHRKEAEAFLEQLRERMRAFGLELHPEKTRLIEFGRHAAENRKRNGRGKPETFNFLGFTHVCGKTRKGRFALVRLTMRQRLRAKLREVKEAFRWRWHDPVPEVGKWLASIIRGTSTTTRCPSTSTPSRTFYKGVVRLWRRGLCRRSHKAHVTWKRMYRIADRFLPRPRIVHPWPDELLCLLT